MRRAVAEDWPPARRSGRRPPSVLQSARMSRVPYARLALLASGGCLSVFALTSGCDSKRGYHEPSACRSSVDCAGSAATGASGKDGAGKGGNAGSETAGSAGSSAIGPGGRPPSDGEGGEGGAPDTNGVQGGTGGTASSVGGGGGGSTGIGGMRGEGTPDSGRASIGGDAGTGGPQGGAGHGGGGNGGTSPVDATPPTVVSISPPNNGNGVASNASIVITFSEAMDKQSVSGALGVSSFSAADLTLDWNGGGDQLTVTPRGGFAYATGTSAGISPRLYTVTLSVGATDLAGNSLAGALNSNFATLRRITQAISGGPVAHWDSYGHSVGSSIATCQTSTETFQIGSWSGSVSGGSYYGYVVVDGSTLGDPSAITKFESAVFSGEQVSPDAIFYPAGTVTLEKLDYAPLDNDIWMAKVAEPLGSLATSAVSTPSEDITTSFWNGYSSGQQKQLYRVSSSGSPLGVYTYFTCFDWKLTATYLIP